MVICDSQVHAPDTPHVGPVGGIPTADLLREMGAAGVQRCVIVPLAGAGDSKRLNNELALSVAQAFPDRFAVMGPFDLDDPTNLPLLPQWKSQRGMLGIRLAFGREPNRSLLVHDQLDWFWTACERAGIPLMLLVPDMVDKLSEIAESHPGLRLTLDHMGLTPHVVYDNLMPAIEPVVRLARHANIAVKASALPCATHDPYPFRSLHEPVHRVIDAFGPHRVFWGSDLTRLPCSYSECVRLFTDELQFLSSDEKNWILGRGVMEWLGWDTDWATS